MSKRDFSERILSGFWDIRRHEFGRALLLLLSLFVLLVSYYILKTLREPMILAASASDSAILESGVLWSWVSDMLSMRGPYKRIVAAACQSFLLLFFVPVFSFVATRLHGYRLVFAVTVFFILNLLYFGYAMFSGIAFTGFVFFIWVGIFSVAMVSLFWSYAADIYNDSDGKRIFPIIGIGASLGAPLGALAADGFIGASVSEWGIMGASVAGLVCFLVLIFIVERGVERGSRAVSESGTDSVSSRGGFMSVLRSPYLFSMAIVIMLLNLVNTTGEYILSEMVVAHAGELIAADGNLDERSVIGSLYANFYFWVNIVSFFLQAVVVSRLVKYAGMKSLIFLLPLICLGVGFVAMRWMKTAENSTNYSVMNTARAMLFLVVSEGEKYKAKQAIDTFFVRIGDMAAAFVVIVVGGGLQLGVRGIAFMNVGFVLLWLGVSWIMWRCYRVRVK